MCVAWRRSAAVKYGDSQLAIFHVPRRGYFAVQQVSQVDHVKLIITDQPFRRCVLISEHLSLIMVLSATIRTAISMSHALYIRGTTSSTAASA